MFNVKNINIVESKYHMFINISMNKTFFLELIINLSF